MQHDIPYIPLSINHYTLVNKPLYNNSAYGVLDFDKAVALYKWSMKRKGKPIDTTAILKAQISTKTVNSSSPGPPVTKAKTKQPLNSTARGGKGPKIIDEEAEVGKY